MSHADASLLDKIRPGNNVEVSVSQPRSLEHHRKFMSAVRFVCEHSDTGLSVDDMLTYIKIGVGHCQYVRLRGELTAIPRSIAFGNMDQTKFTRFYHRALDFLLESVVPESYRNRDELAETIEAYMEER